MPSRIPHRSFSLLPIVACGFAATVLLAGCGDSAKLKVAEGIGPAPALPDPVKTLLPTVDIAPAAGWSAAQAPKASEGKAVQPFATGLEHPRWLYVLPNGDVLVAESNAPPRPEEKKGVRNWVMGKVMARAGAGVPSADRITLLRDADGDGTAETRSVFADASNGLHSPIGMTLIGDTLYVANTDAIVSFGYKAGQTKVEGSAQRVTDLPAGPRNHHWTKNVIAAPDGKKLYATVGSNSNVAEHGMAAEEGRAAIWEIDPANGSKRLFASGLRNPNGMTWVATGGANQLWTVVNERDEIGSDLVPDYMTSVRDGGFYGWPYSYYGGTVDARVKPPQPEKVAAALKPDYALGPHTASLGLVYSDRNALGAGFEQGMFIGQHGSWNRKPKSGYKVVFVPFKDGRPNGMPIDVLTGFLGEDDKAHGRPVGVAIDARGALLVADDVGNAVWRVSAGTSRTAEAPR